MSPLKREICLEIGEDKVFFACKHVLNDKRGWKGLGLSIEGLQSRCFTVSGWVSDKKYGGGQRRSDDE